MLDLPDLAVALAFELEERQAWAQGKLRRQAEELTLAHRLLAETKRELRAVHARLAEAQAQTCERCASYREDVKLAQDACRRKNDELAALRKGASDVRLLRQERDTWADIAHNAQVDRDRYKEKLRLALATMEDAREMVK